MKNSELFFHLSHLKTRNAILLFFMLYKNGACRESDLVKYFKMDANTLRKTLGLLASENFAHFVIDKENVTYYMMDRMFYHKDSDIYQKILLSEKNVKLVNLGGVRIKAKSVEQRKVEEVAEFIKKIYFKTFGGSHYPYGAHITHRFCREMLLIFKKLVKSSVYDHVLNDYLVKCFSKMSESAGFNLRKLSDMDNIIRFVENRSEASKCDVKVCAEYGMNCSYCDVNGCKLDKDGIKCTEKIREHMQKKYGFKV